jgi:hypothetical protein
MRPGLIGPRVITPVRRSRSSSGHARCGARPRPPRNRRPERREAEASVALRQGDHVPPRPDGEFAAVSRGRFGSATVSFRKRDWSSTAARIACLADSKTARASSPVQEALPVQQLRRNYMRWPPDSWRDPERLGAHLRSWAAHVPHGYRSCFRRSDPARRNERRWILATAATLGPRSSFFTPQAFPPLAVAAVAAGCVGGIATTEALHGGA